MRKACSIPFKRGGDFELNCTLQHSGMVVPITGWTVDCWLRAKDGRLVQRLAFDLVNADAGRYRLTAAPAQTVTWPIGELEGDIRYIDDSGRVMHTATFTVDVLPPITTPPLTP